MEIKQTKPKDAPKSYPFDEYLKEQLKNNKVVADFWRENEIFREFGYAVYNARRKANMTQKELSKASGIAQSEISKLECGESNLSLKTMQKLACGLNMKFKFEFTPDT